MNHRSRVFKFNYRSWEKSGRSFREITQSLQQLIEFTTLFTSQETSGLELVLNKSFKSLTSILKTLLKADFCSVYIFEPETDELWSAIVQNVTEKSIELRFPSTTGITGEVALSKKTLNIPFEPSDFYAKYDPNRLNQPHYPIYTLLFIPLVSPETESVLAVFQFLNKLDPARSSHLPLLNRIDRKGFTSQDEENFEKISPFLRQIVELIKNLVAQKERQQRANAITHSLQNIYLRGLDLDLILQQTIEEVRTLIPVDRSVLWMINPEKHELWTKILIGATPQKLCIPQNAGIVGSVVESGNLLNIPFDLYDDPRGTAIQKNVDIKTRYRVCNLLCVPLHNAQGNLIGVMQLINKTKPGNYPPYDPAAWPEAPPQWQTSFNHQDIELITAFNQKLAILVQNALEFAKLQENYQTLQAKHENWAGEENIN